MFSVAQLEELETALLQIAVSAPTVEFVANYKDAIETCLMTEVARQIGLKPRKLNYMMLMDKVVHRIKSGATLRPFAAHMNSKYFEILPFFNMLLKAAARQPLAYLSIG